MKKHLAFTFLAALIAISSALANTGTQSPVATCYDPKATARPGDSMIQKLDLATVNKNGRPFALAGKGIQMIAGQNSQTFPVLFTVGGPYRAASPSPQALTYSFSPALGLVKYIEFAQAPYEINQLTLDYRNAMVSIDIMDANHNHGTLTARGCVFH